jgi:hypothetical protein
MGTQIRVSKTVKYGTLSATVEVGTVSGKSGALKDGHQWVGPGIKVKVQNRNVKRQR